MDLEKFKLLNKAERDAYGKTLPLGYTRDVNGYMLSQRCDNDDWCVFTRNDKGNPLTYKDSYGFWYESTYDENGRDLTYKDSDGDDCVYLHYGDSFTLSYNSNTKRYEAGCQELTYDECLEFYDKNKNIFDDADIFIEKIKEHHLTLQDKRV